MTFSASSDSSPPFASDERDVDAARRGDLDAFDCLVARHQERIFRFCLWSLQDREEAQDAAQEAFIRAFRHLKTFRGDCAFSTWLHRLTVNQVLMHFRRRSVKNEKTSDDGEMPEQTMPGTTNPNKMQVIDRIALKNAIAQLPNGYHKVFVLHDVKGYEHEEVARMMGISVGTSKSQLHKARLKLRGLLLKQND